MAGTFGALMVDAYACLALLGLPPEEDAEKAAARAAKIAEHRAKVVRLTNLCPLNFRQWLLLVEAEEARIAGQYAEGIALCDEVIALVDKSEVLPAAWIANELAAKLYLALGKPKLARPYWIWRRAWWRRKPRARSRTRSSSRM